jgi:hypothetical protein
MFELIRNRFTGLETLSMRDAFGKSSEPIWVTEPITKKPYWAPYPSLTSLKLTGCLNVNSSQVPELVQHFHSLEHLLIGNSHSNHGPVVHDRKRRWSSRPGEWWNLRKPLKSVHIEHLYGWEVLAMGTIPTIELTAVRLRKTNAFIVFKQDEEIFPHLKSLYLEPLSGDINRDEHALGEDQSVSHIWEGRGIDIRRDAAPFIRYSFTFQIIR